MRISVKSAAVSAVTLTVGLVIGCLVTAKMARRMDTEMIHALVLSNASLKTVHFTKLLTTIQGGKQELAVDRMEALLSSAVRDIGREYSPSRDINGIASRALVLANEYRAAHPYKDRLDSVAQETSAALRTKTVPVKPYWASDAVP